MEIEAQRYWMTVLQSYTTSKWLGHESISSCVWLQPRWFPIICTFLTFWYFRNKIHTFLLVSFRLGRDQIANILWIIEKAREFQKNIYFCFIAMPKPLTVCITINCGKFWKRWEYQTTWPASWEICMQVRKQQFEPDMEHQTGSK